MSYVYAGQYGAEQMVNSSGAPLSNTAITVYTHGTTTLATLYTDRTKATQAANPVTTDSVGNLIFWADPGQYDLTVSGLPTTNTVLVPLDPSETSVVSSTAVGGDVSGTISAETVAKIEGFALASTTPTSNQALVWDNSTSKWTPTTMVAADVTNAADTSSASTQTFTGDVKAPALIASGLTGATAASRYVGATTIGTPPTGTFVTGDFVIDQSGSIYVCTLGGSPGTWARTVAGGTAGGDLSGTYPSPTVAKIQGTAVSSTAPTTSQVLIYNGTDWTPETQVFNVKAYGAKGDAPTTDDTTAIQAAITAASTGGDVYFPYTSSGYLCGALTVPPGVRLLFANGAKLVAPSSLASSWVALTAAAHVDTAILGGTFDATAVTSTSCTAVLDFGSNPTSLSNVRCDGNRIINAPLHGIYMKDPGFTNLPKWIRGNSVEGAGIKATGFGIYADYIGNLEIAGNAVTVSGVDAIELGHSGPAHLGGLDAHIRCIGNNVTGGGIQFPSSDGAVIVGNSITAGTQGIQNDGNTADGVTIVGNVLTDISPASGYGAISIDGAHATVTGNNISVASTSTAPAIGGTGNGGLFTDTLIAGNTILLANSSQVGVVVSNLSSVATRNQIVGNHIQGTGAYGIAVAGNKVGIRDNYIAVTGTGIFLYASGTIGYIMDSVDASGNDVSQSGTAYSASTAPTNSEWRDNKGVNPFGSETVTVPASGTAVGAVYYDRTFYVTTASGTTSCTLAVENGPTVTAVASTAQVIPVFVPAGKTMTPTYGGTAPTWVVEGN